MLVLVSNYERYVQIKYDLKVRISTKSNKRIILKMEDVMIIQNAWNTSLYTTFDVLFVILPSLSKISSLSHCLLLTLDNAI